MRPIPAASNKVSGVILSQRVASLPSATPFIFIQLQFTVGGTTSLLTDSFFFHAVSGLNDREGRGRWEWVGGEPVNYTNWRKTPPRSKMKGSRKCVLVWRRAKWQIRDCKTSRGHRFVCSVKT